MKSPVQATQHTASSTSSPSSTAVTFHPLGGGIRAGFDGGASAARAGASGGGESDGSMARGSMHPVAPRDNTTGQGAAGGTACDAQASR